MDDKYWLNHEDCLISWAAAPPSQLVDPAVKTAS
jgi:hypothetical protein